MTDRAAGRRDRTRLGAALDRLRAVVDPVDRTERLPVAGAVGRVLVTDVTARRPLPDRDRAATDGYAVRASDTFDAGDRSPAVLDPADDGTATEVGAGDELPAGADAVVRTADARRVEGAIEVRSPVTPGENVAAAGADFEEGETVLPAGRRLRQSDPGVCAAVGAGRVDVLARPTVGVVPTGDELVGGPAGTDEVVDTNGLTVASFAERWGGKPTRREPVGDDRESLRVALTRDLTRDLVVTTGGTGGGADDLVPGVVADEGEMLVRGVALAPGRSAGLGLVRETPVLTLPGAPVACLVTAVQLLRPAIRRAGGLPLDPHPTTEARLDGKLPSEVGVRTVARVALDREADDGPVARPLGTGSGGLSGLAAADGWVVVPESREGLPAGERVTVEDWEFEP